MMSFKTALVMLLLAVLAMVAKSSSGKEKGPYKYDLSNKSDLNKLYSSKVYMAERFTRPLDWMHWSQMALEDGSKWLIHKGDDYGKSSQTVVVDGRHISSNWKLKGQKKKKMHGMKTVSDFVKAGGADYNLLFDNCHNGANRMMNG